MFKVVISNINSGITINKYLEKLGVAVQRKKQLNSLNTFYVNKTLVSGDFTLQENDLFEIDLSLFETKKYRPINFNLTIIYEDDYLIAVDKPSGYIVYDLDDIKDTICNFLRSYYKQSKKNFDIIPIHRLDTDTSGCLIFAKDVITAASLSRKFEKNEVTKKYIALVSGLVEKEGCINKKIGKDRHINGKMVIFDKGKEALTKYRLIKSNSKFSLVEAIPITGRTHQIRVHLSSIGNPIVGDQLYKSKISNDRIMLHCQSISFIHPIKEKAVTLYSPLPEEFEI